MQHVHNGSAYKKLNSNIDMKIHKNFEKASKQIQ